VSASSSPSKPHSPHTPHTPAIPSRLSENSVADNSGARRGSSRQVRTESTVPESSRENTITQEGTTAIDIPLSPRLGSYQRRSSSVAQQSRALIDEEGPDAPGGNRSISLGGDDRDPPTISGLLGRQLERESEARKGESESLQPAAELRAAETSAVMNRHDSSEDNPSENFMSGITSNSPYGRRRYAGMGARRNSRQTPPQSSRGSFTGSIGRSREDNESLSGEPLMFDLSEVDPQVRKSVDEARSGQTSTDRGSYDSRGSSRRW
jgi:autophagy-related protein 13